MAEKKAETQHPDPDRKKFRRLAIAAESFSHGEQDCVTLHEWNSNGL